MYIDWEEQKKINETMKAYIATGNFEAVEMMIQGVTDYHLGEAYAIAILKAENAPQALIDAGLERFVNTRKNRRDDHGNWVHSLSHFTELIWKRGRKDWIKRLNLIAFTGAVELNDTSCSDRLVDDFGKYSEWNDNPVDFHITPEFTGWIKWEWREYAKKRIEAGVFPSEEAYAAWQLENCKS